MKNKNLILSLTILAGLAALLTGYSFIPAPTSGIPHNSTASVELRTTMRKLWQDHVTWTRNVVFNIIDGLPGTDQAVKRLMKNQDEIGSAVESYYGADAGKKLTDLLHTHISTAADVLKAVKADNKSALDEANKRWYDNADQIAEFLSKANPNLKNDDMKKMMHTHLDLLTDETMARKKKDYDADVKAYDKTVDEILEMADMISTGVVKQFPDKFKETELGEK
jgi:hypothetical protein